MCYQHMFCLMCYQHMFFLRWDTPGQRMCRERPSMFEKREGLTRCSGVLVCWRWGVHIEMDTVSIYGYDCMLYGVMDGDDQ